MYHFPVDPPSSEQYQRQLSNFNNKPLEELLQQSDWPIGNLADRREPCHYGVARIDNIPYTVTRQEVVQLFGRSANLIHHSLCPIHIVMERSTGKTMTCFAEFDSHESAKFAVDRVNCASDSHIGPRMGNRHVDVSLSSQEELMRALFPMAKCLDWVNDHFVSRKTVPNEWYSSGFDGFLTDEELFCVLRHAKEPHRSAFAGKVPQRTYESIISTIWKFPWYATDMYTVHARNKLFDTILSMVNILVTRVSTTRTVGLDYRLVSELMQAGLRCPSFNPRMKYALVEAGRDQATLGRMSRDYLSFFPFDTLTWLSPYDVTSLSVHLPLYAEVMRRGRVSQTEQQGLVNRHNDPTWAQLYGRQLFVWDDETALKKTFADAVTYELGVLRSLLIAGYGNSGGRHASVSSIGTAPPNSPPERRAAPTSNGSRSAANNWRSGQTSTSNARAPSGSNAQGAFSPSYHAASQSWDPSVAASTSGASQGRAASNVWRDWSASGGGGSRG